MQTTFKQKDLSMIIFPSKRSNPLLMRLKDPLMIIFFRLKRFQYGRVSFHPLRLTDLLLLSSSSSSLKLIDLTIGENKQNANENIRQGDVEKQKRLMKAVCRKTIIN